MIILRTVDKQGRQNDKEIGEYNFIYDDRKILKDGTVDLSHKTLMYDDYKFLINKEDFPEDKIHGIITCFEGKTIIPVYYSRTYYFINSQGKTFRRIKSHE